MKANCHTIKRIPHSQRNEKVTLIVVIITLITMFGEIITGALSGSMALLSDGIHMGTHALALFITLTAYLFARKHMHNPSFSFGTGKVGVLGGYTNAILLLLAGGAMAVESVERLVNPVRIHFNEAIVVAIIGLAVNIASAIILHDGNSGHAHSHDDCYEHHSHESHHHYQDHNLKAAYLHVITDAMTSVLAILALLTAKFFNYEWADPAVAILGAIVVIRWAIGLLKQTGSVLLDKGDFSDEIKSIKSCIESDTTHIQDIHVWQISENERSLIISLTSSEDKPPKHYHDIIREVDAYDHITVEVNSKDS
jgi:cation diffusion facilitator family transporter